MANKITAIIIDGSGSVLACHKKDTDEANANWYLPSWEVISDNLENELMIGLKKDVNSEGWKIITSKKLEDTHFYILKNTSLDIDRLKGEQYDEYEYRPWQVIRDMCSEEVSSIYKLAFLKLRRSLEASYRRWLRIFIKLIAAIVLLLLPYAIFMNLLKDM